MPPCWAVLFAIGCGRIGFDATPSMPDATTPGVLGLATLPHHQWSRVQIHEDAPSNTPYRTGWSGAVFDTTNRQLLLYERYIDADNAGYTYSNAMWGFDLATASWVLRQQSPWRNTGYCAISNVGASYDFPWDRQPSNQMAFDAETSTMYMYGGASSNCFGSDDTTHVWLLHADTETWESRQPQQLPTVYSFYEGTFALDTDRRRIVSSVIGGDTLWQYDLSLNVWSPLVAPAALALHQDQLGMVYASRRHAVLAFGGHVYGQPGTAETYEMEGATDTWTLLSPPSSPPARFGMGLAYSADDDVALLYGGHDGSSVLADTWLFDFATGTWLAMDATGPIIDSPNVPLVYDPYDHVFLLPVAPGGLEYSEMWVFKL